MQPGDGLGTILPGETISREVLFQPIAGTRVKLDLVCRTTLNRRFVLKATGRTRTRTRTQTQPEPKPEPEPWP